MRTIALLVAVVFLSSSCAAMLHGTKETIHVRSQEPDTVFYLDARDTREIGKGTSAVTTIPKKQLGSAKLRATKTGCTEKTSPIVTQFDAVTLLGILIGGISIIIDVATGATTKASQTDYILTPECK